MNNNSMFWTAFWAGLASPTCLYSAPIPYTSNIAIYSVAGSFAQVGMALTQTTAPIFNGGQTDGFEYSKLPGEPSGEFAISGTAVSAA